ncbi:SagB/ThcOx family dehydrogenase [Opitutales bacterium]|nr:SagB/ThcOx family dehydrogenase [Opitutales bacterium]
MKLSKQIPLYQFDDSFRRVILSSPTSDTELEDQFYKRKSIRQFDETELSKDLLGELFEPLRQIRTKERVKRLFGSAGGLYPVQIYVYLKANRLRDFEGGAYYYDSDHHELVHLSDGDDIKADLYNPLVNVPIFESSSFAIYLFAGMDAIEPIYGAHSERYTSIEAGLITQILETNGPKLGIGICQVGELEVEKLKPSFQLNDRHRFVHSLLGGPLPNHSA